jgi:hypothetical protein
MMMSMSKKMATSKTPGGMTQFDPPNTTYVNEKRRNFYH